MVSYILHGHEYINTVQTGIQIFYPMRRYARVFDITSQGITVISRLEPARAVCRAYENGAFIGESKVPRQEGGEPKEDMILLKTAIYDVLSARTGYIPPWGIQTGIRPAKLFGILLESGMSREEAILVFVTKYRVRREKAELAAEVYEYERKLLRSGKGGYSLYTGIPFCPARCLYCSFPSYPIKEYAGRVGGYLDALEKELRFLGELSRGSAPDSVYIGGGTPTSLSGADLDRLLAVIGENFAKPIEFTVEAGRPDTITGEKLDIIKAHGATRISINPQTMNEKTLRAIGRGHSVSDIKRAFYMAREKGFGNINMDIILGLPGEGGAEVARTFDEISFLAPDSVTVHTLAVKRASRLKEVLSQYSLAKARVIENMTEEAEKAAKEMGLHPYYMYRQKNMLGSFENVGYSREGAECIYNVKIMEETQTILAAGAGAVTKTLDMETGRIDRTFNVKNVDQYIDRIDEMIARKRKAIKKL